VADWEHPRIEGNTVILSNTAPAEAVEPTLAEVQAAKLTEINAACTTAIEAGCDVTLSDGTAGHITLTLPDQINLSTAQEAIAAGKTGYAYHLDRALCEVYPAADIAIMAQAATAHVLYHQTYCNHVRAWVKRCETAADVEAITYGGSLPDDLAAHMETILAAAGGGSDA
jgi:glutathione S-transferase